MGSIVLYVGYEVDPPGEFGAFDDIEYEPDEDSPDDNLDMAIIYSQIVKQIMSSSASNGIFEDLYVVPDVVLQGARDDVID